MTEYLTTQQAADILKRSVPTLKRWRRDNVGPPCFKNENTVLYSKARLIEWIEDHTS